MMELIRGLQDIPYGWDALLVHGFCFMLTFLFVLSLVYISGDRSKDAASAKKD